MYNDVFNTLLLAAIWASEIFVLGTAQWLTDRYRSHVDQFTTETPVLIIQYSVSTAENLNVSIQKIKSLDARNSCKSSILEPKTGRTKMAAIY